MFSICVDDVIFFEHGEGWRGCIELLWAFLAARSLTQHICLAVTQPFLDAASRKRRIYLTQVWSDVIEDTAVEILSISSSTLSKFS